MKTYDTVKEILELDEHARNSDTHLMWEFWKKEKKATGGEFAGGVWKEGYMTETDFSHATPPESISRARRKIQEEFPELGATNPGVKKIRDQKEDTKGTFVYRENIEEGRLF